MYGFGLLIKKAVLQIESLPLCITVLQKLNFLCNYPQNKIILPFACKSASLCASKLIESNSLEMPLLKLLHGSTAAKNATMQRKN